MLDWMFEFLDHKTHIKMLMFNLVFDVRLEAMKIRNCKSLEKLPLQLLFYKTPRAFLAIHKLWPCPPSKIDETYKLQHVGDNALRVQI
jgi:hypothetical protein